MTWKQFKALMESHGVKDEDGIEYIDVTQPSPGEKLEIIREEDSFRVYN